MEEAKKNKDDKIGELACGVGSNLETIFTEAESKNKLFGCLANAILKETKERLVVPAYQDKSEAENTADWVIQSFTDYLDKMYFVRDMSYLARAIGYYLINSKDNEHIKSETMKVFESVLNNDEAYKEASDYLFALKNALCDMVGN